MTDYVMCPTCHGEREFDFRDGDAILAEHLPPATLAFAKALSGELWGAVIPCPECDGTGLTTTARARDLQAAAVAAVDQIIALFDDGRRA